MVVHWIRLLGVDCSTSCIRQPGVLVLVHGLIVRRRDPVTALVLAPVDAKIKHSLFLELNILHLLLKPLLPRIDCVDSTTVKFADFSLEELPYVLVPVQSESLLIVIWSVHLDQQADCVAVAILSLILLKFLL